MGQKVNPIIFRISGGTLSWNCDWYTKTKAEYRASIAEDVIIVNYVYKSEIGNEVASINIERKSKTPHIFLKVIRIANVVGKKAKVLEEIQTALLRITGKKVSFSVNEVKKHEIIARVLGLSVSSQIKKRISYKKAVKGAIDSAMGSGALGVKIIIGGRLNGAEIARSETFKEGSMPLHTIREPINYAVVECLTPYGIIGIKVWVFLKHSMSSWKQ